MSERWLVALPVFNEVKHVDRVLDEVKRYCRDILVVDDGSTDGTAEVLARPRTSASFATRKTWGTGAV